MWAFAEAWPPAEASSSCWATLSASLASLLPASLTRVAQLSLGARTHSPKVELVRSLLEDEVAGRPGDGAVATACCLAVVSGGRAATDVAGLEAALAAAGGDEGGADDPPLFDFDHVHGGDAPDPAPPVTAILYGAPGTPCFKAMHSVLAGASKAAAAAVERAGGSLAVTAPVTPPAETAKEQPAGGA